MRSLTHHSRSIATEMALLALKELEPQVANDPELLVSTEAVLSFAAIRHADPEYWEHWRAILEKYDKSQLVEFMLREPARVEDPDWESEADRLIGLALDTGLKLFHDPDQRGWASVSIGGHWENHSVRSRDFRLFLLRTYYVDTGESPGGQAIRAALELFEARALFDGEEFPVHLRVAEHGGRLYLDLCDRSWRAIEIDLQGWRVVDRPIAKFRRTRGSQALPEPERGGCLEELRAFFNVDHHSWTLIRAFLVAALRPGLPCPILVVKGEQGAGKSTACRVISSLIDPRTSALRGVPREVRDLTAAAKNSWLVCFDNLSRLPEELADAACRLATGGGFGGRELYSDHDEAIFDATRPLVFNAIPDIGTARPDFLDRALIVEFPGIKPEVRRDEAQFWSEFSERRPRILGALLDATVAGLRNLPQVKLDRPPRLADFALWVSACEEALGMKQGEAVAACQANCAETRDLALEASPLYGPLAELAREGFRGTVAELHARLHAMVSEPRRRSLRWPKAPNVLGNALRRMATNLRAAGIELQFSRNDGQGRRMVSVLLSAAQVRERPSVVVSDRQ
ncbi:MAG TPA: hypothetical protein VNE82_22160 [Candidatus Binataceae bacterium]|nr:hypothetical protein [Candidatus Binataceae bacterium]